MNFINELKLTQDTIALSGIMPFDEDKTFRMFEGIKLNDSVFISIQASYGHYCSPRKTLLDLNEYTAMEFALMIDGDFVTVSDVLPTFSRLKEIEEYEETVYSYVPVDLIEDLYNELKEVKVNESKKVN